MADVSVVSLWRVTKNGHTATAGWRLIEGYPRDRFNPVVHACEIRYGVDGELRTSRTFQTYDELMAESKAKHEELLALGWTEDIQNKQEEPI